MLALPKIVFGQISGRLFDNGNKERGTHIERPIVGLSIKAYGLLNTGKYGLISQTSSNDKGQYFLDIPIGKQVKIEFDGKSKHLQSNGSTPAVVFVKSPASNVDWGGYRPSQYVSHNPYLVSPVYISGKGHDSLNTLKAISLEDTISFSLASSSQVGALWAVAYDKIGKQLYSAAVAKRHVGYGPLGTGGIYRTDWITRTTSNWLDLRSLGIPTGDDHHEGLIASIDSSSADPKLMADVGKLSLGGMDISEATQELFVMNLSDRTLYSIKLPVDTTYKPSKKDVTAYPIPMLNCNGGVGRPFAVKVHDNKVFIGIVCDAQTSQSVEDLTASVLEMNIATKKFSKVFSMPLNYVRGNAISGLSIKSWYPWTDDFNHSLHKNFPSTAARPQPILSSIAFDASGVMILGFMDRFGHQSGAGQQEPGGKASYSGVAAGDVLRVYPRNPRNVNSKFKLETNAVAGTFSSEGKGNFQGPQGGEFFFKDDFTYKGIDGNKRIIHEETASGGLVILPETQEVLVAAHEPTDTFNSGGIKSFYSEDGKISRGWLLYNDGEIGTFGKANGIGGLAIISDLPKITVGNRIWADTNSNGIQDPDEPAIPNVELELWKDETILAHTISNSEGNYIFNEENVKGGLRPNTEYQIKIKLKEKVIKLSRFKSSIDPEIDNDGVELDGYAIASFKTSKSGESIHNMDFGFLLDQIQTENIDSEDNFIVYPNPFVEDLKLEAKSYGKSAIIKLTDLNGRILQTKTIKAQDGMYKTNLSPCRKLYCQY